MNIWPIFPGLSPGGRVSMWSSLTRTQVPVQPTTNTLPIGRMQSLFLHDDWLCPHCYWLGEEGHGQESRVYYCPCHCYSLHPFSGLSIYIDATGHCTQRPKTKDHTSTTHTKSADTVCPEQASAHTKRLLKNSPTTHRASFCCLPRK